jgi:AcrR family transcriptional regulator
LIGHGARLADRLVDSVRHVNLRERAAQYSAAQRRTIAAALDLFADHGVGGTSLQMIADAVGVTKAAIYHQFPTKEAIVVGVLEVTLSPLETALEVAEGERKGLKSREALLRRLVDAAVDQRRAISTLQNDPTLVRLLGEYEPSRHLWARLFAVLLGHDLGDKERARAAALSAAIGSVGHPFVADVDDDTLRAELLKLARGLIMLPG